jgi:hypothetical protein
MHKPKVHKPVVGALIAIYGLGYGTGYVKDVPTKALSILATATSNSTASTLKMPDMINHKKEYDLRPLSEFQRRTLVIPSS